MNNTSSESKLDLAALVEIARTIEPREAVAEAICAHAIEALDLAGASISLVSHDTGEPHLESMAAVGQLSQFIRDMSTPMDKQTDANQTALGGEPIFVGNPHGMDENADAGPAAGVSRWRNGFGAHAYAVLALTVLEGTIGVLTLEWPEPHPFADEDREDLTRFADAVALVLRFDPGATSDSPPTQTTDAPAAQTTEEVAETSGDTASSPPEDTALASYCASTSGLLMPAALAGSWGQSTAAHIWTATSSADLTAAGAPFAEVVATPDGGVLTAVGAVSAGSEGSSSQKALIGREVIRAAATHGSAPADILGMLGGSMRSQSGGAWASAALAIVHPETGAMELAQLGAVATVTLRRDRRVEVTSPEAPSEEAGHEPSATLRLALPGDRIAVLSGRVIALDDPICVAEIEYTLARLDELGGEEAARLLLALVRNADTPAAVALIELIAGSESGSS